MVYRQAGGDAGAILVSIAAGAAAQTWGVATTFVLGAYLIADYFDL